MRNKKTASCFISVLLLLFACSVSGKEPSVAGSFYPADKDTLSATIEGFLSKAEKSQVSGQLIALISPHAGYKYSGLVAACGFRQLRGMDIRKVILIGPAHHAGFTGASVYTKGSFRTPLGDVKINEKLSESLLSEKADVRFSPEAYEKEHSLEVQLPFLQTVLKDFTIVPILVGTPTRKTFDHLTAKLAEMLDEKTIIVTSTDLSHYHDYAKAKEMDGRIISAIERLSPGDAGNLLKTGESELCGGFPVLITIETVRRHGANLGAVFGQANSGDVTGDRSGVVGYASIGLIKDPLTEGEKKELLALAKNAISGHVTGGKTPDLKTVNPKFRTDGAVFVTIKEKGALRGCIGHVQAVMPLYQSILRNAVAASSADPRFPPVKKEELKDIDIEISVLSPLTPVGNIQEIQVGKHGLVISKGYRSGLLLPQVPAEFGWDRDDFLRHLCMKADLPEDAWKDAELFRFTAEIIK